MKRFLYLVFCSVMVLFMFFSSGCMEDSKDSNDEVNTSIRFGAAVGPDYLDESDYSVALRKYFNCIVAENHMKWALIAPKPAYNMIKSTLGL